MKKIFRFVVFALACYRVSRMIASERGPDDIFARLRYKTIGLKAKDEAALYLTPDDVGANGEIEHWVTAGVKCKNCLSFWVSFLFAALYLKKTRVGDFLANALAMSAIVTKL